MINMQGNECYECYRCGYKTNFKSSMYNHFKRKNICVAIYNDIDFNICKKYILSGYNYKQYIDIINNINNNTIINNTNTIISNNTTDYNNSKTHNNICKYCEKSFSHNTSLIRHIKSCKVKNNIINKQQMEIKELKDNNKTLQNDNETLQNDNEKLNDYIHELEKNTKQLQKNLLEKVKFINTMENTTNTTNNTNNTLNMGDNNTIGNNNNNVNNIIINAFDNTKLDCLTDDEIYECLKTMSDSYIKVLEKIHFNNNHPENQNVYLSNLRLNTMRVFNGSLWTTIDKEEALIKICDNCTGIFDNFIGDCENNDKYPILQTKYYKYQQQITENDEEYDKMYKKVENCIYDNSKVMKIKPP